MSDVSNEKVIAIAPSSHIPLLHRGPVIVPKWLVHGDRAKVGIGHQAESILDAEERKRLPQQSLPMVVFDGRPCIQSLAVPFFQWPATHCGEQGSQVKVRAWSCV